MTDLTRLGTVGNADGLGDTRKKELTKSASILGIRSDNDVLVLNDPYASVAFWFILTSAKELHSNFPDSMTTNWSPSLISNLLLRTFASNHAKTFSKNAPTASIDVLLTFDRHGISSHPNHISLYHGSVVFLKSLMSKHTGWDCPVKLYTLRSISIARKYVSVLDAPATILSVIFLSGKREAGETPSPLFFVAGMGDYLKGRDAMTKAHQSQMRWFRWGWIGVGRYMVINDLRKEKGF